jgi:hypothetical protein
MYKRGLYTVSSVQMNVRRQYFSVQIDGNLHLKKSTPHPQTLPPYPALFKSHSRPFQKPLYYMKLSS